MRTIKMRPATGREVTPFSATDLTLAETGEATVHDLILAERLGFVDPRDIRELIDRNREELEAFGILPYRTAKSNGRGRPRREYHLNRQQALLVTILSKTSIAAQVRRQMIAVFDAALRGIPPRQPAPPPVVALGLTPDQVRDRLAGLERAIFAVMDMIPETPALPAPAGRPAALPAPEPEEPVPPSAPDMLYGVKAIAAHLGLKHRQAQYLVEARRLPNFRIGSVICARRSDLAAWLDNLAAEREVRASAQVRAGACA